MALDTRIPLMVQNADTATPLAKFAETMRQKEQDKLALEDRDYNRARQEKIDARQDRRLDLRQAALSGDLKTRAKDRYESLTPREQSRARSTVIAARHLKSLMANPQEAEQFLKTRKATLQQRIAAGEDVDTTETDQALKMLKEDPGGLKASLDQMEQYGVFTGILEDQAGVPTVPLDTRGMSDKDASMFTKQTRATAQKKIDETAEAAKKARDNQRDADRFTDLMKVQETGGVYSMIPDAALRWDDELGEMKSIQDRLTPQQRTPGSGATSDFDARMFSNALPGVSKTGKANENIITAIRAREQDVLNYQSFLTEYLERNGHLNGSEAAWSKYVNDNPIFDPEASPENLTLNKNRKGYQEYFSAKPKQEIKFLGFE
jgi:hypothetical protein